MDPVIVDVVSPASPPIEKEIKNSFLILKKMNFIPRFIGSHKKHFPFFAQNETESYSNFKKALWAKDSSYVWAMRGGYGSQRIIKKLTQLKTKPPCQKLFIGHSDVTVIHDWIHQHLKWPTLHFPNLASLPSLSSSSLKKLQNILSDQKPIQFSSLKLINKKFPVGGIKAFLTGGNLTLIQSSIGTPAFVPRKNQILFLEDINIKPYQVHRALWQMAEAGVFQKVRAVIFGRWVEYDHAILKEVLKPWSNLQSFPVFVNLPCGHARINDPLPLGIKAQLQFKNKLFTLQVKPSFVL